MTLRWFHELQFIVSRVIFPITESNEKMKQLTAILSLINEKSSENLCLLILVQILRTRVCERV